MSEFLRYALSQRGRRYVWGSSGHPFDCSEFVKRVMDK